MKYLEKYTENPERSVLETFFKYVREQWVDSPTFRWYEGSHPYHVSNNQGLEGINKEIKAGHTFKRRCPLGNLFEIVARMLNEMSLEDDSALFTSRLADLEGKPNSLKLKTEGYNWFRQNKMGTDKILCIPPRDRYTVSVIICF